MEYPESQVAVGSDGRRWRKCAAAAIFNSSGAILVGERVKIKGAWNCPQGGMDAVSKKHGGPESVLEAAAREAFEEVGLKIGEAIAPVATMADDDAVQYEAGGWLKKEGFAGQQLHWALFVCCDPVCDSVPDLCCNLGGLGGEEAEFSEVRWQPLEHVIENMWPAKRAPYEALRAWAYPILTSRLAAANALDFSGTWARDAAQNRGVQEALAARGLAADVASAEASRPYVQRWALGSEPGEWVVTTANAEGPGRDRVLVYAMGDWEEEYSGRSALYGEATVSDGFLLRRTGWLARSDDDVSSGAQAGSEEPWLAPSRVAHCTWTTRHNGAAEITERSLRGAQMVVRRTWLSAMASGATRRTSEETFVRQAQGA